MVKSKITAKLLIAALLLAALVPVFSGCSDDRESINVFNWGEFIDTEVIRMFEREYNMRVNYTTYATNEELYTKLQGNVNYDVIIPSDYMLGRLIEENMLEELNFENIPNFSHIKDEFRNPEYDPANIYSAPYMWGTVVLIYNTKHVETPTSWDVLWDERYSGRIIMFNNSRDAFGVSLLRLGYSLNTTDEGQLTRAADELAIQRELLHGYFMDEIYDKMIGEEAWFAPYYAGSAVAMIGYNPYLSAVVPAEGANRFVDAMCIPKGAQNKEGAEKFINFMLRPDIAAMNSEYTGYSTPNSGAYELLSEEIRSNPIAYPSPGVLANTEVFLNLPQHINELKDRLWGDVLANIHGR
jgi:spermidine/putrescine transport system substrate-binding protein